MYVACARTGTKILPLHKMNTVTDYLLIYSLANKIQPGLVPKVNRTPVALGQVVIITIRGLYGLREEQG